MLTLLFFGDGAAWARSFSIEGPDAVTDQAGRRIAVEKPYQRIISLYGAHTENLFALGLDKEIIGVSKNEVHPLAALKKPVFSYHDDAERFLAARPDLVLVRPMIDRGYPQLTARLEKSGIAVVSLQPGAVGEMF
ncbi:MAG: ABC transporter substrate-binding protein, partial [Desulfobacterales bacterium]|nr:ABC transporter substrate-binding protein [Desulfobacterales bacterium]